MTDTTFFWHDYETTGVSPSRDRPLQFAGVRTDFDFNVIGDPVSIYCKPPRDILPSPEAALITGITPQLADRQGLIEAEFTALIQQALATPGTCGVGYNSVRFDDEVTRYTLYRNFHDPYAREWQNDCSRWDIIDLARMTCALRPDGIEWPAGDDGKPSFRLELLTRANNISHTSAHDALSDVRATAAFAERLREAQPKLFAWLLGLRNKHAVMEQIDIANARPLVHTTRMYPSELFCTSLVMPLVYAVRNKSSVLVYDLRVDPTEFLELDHQLLENRLFTPGNEMPEGQLRLPVKSLKVNRCPAIAPVATLGDEQAARIGLDLEACSINRQRLIEADGFAERVRAAYESRRFEPVDDVDAALYDGFIGRNDRKLADEVLRSTPAELASKSFRFEDQRLPELLFRYRARNWPETLSETEAAQWREHRMVRFQDPDRGLEPYFESIAMLRDACHDDPEKMTILDAMEEWGDGLLSD